MMQGRGLAAGRGAESILGRGHEGRLLPYGRTKVYDSYYRAREDARRYGTPLVIMQKGKVVEIPPEKIKDLPKSLLKIAYGKNGYTKKQ